MKINMAPGLCIKHKPDISKHFQKHPPLQSRRSFDGAERRITVTAYEPWTFMQRVEATVFVKKHISLSSASCHVLRGGVRRLNEALSFYTIVWAQKNSCVRATSRPVKKQSLNSFKRHFNMQKLKTQCKVFSHYKLIPPWIPFQTIEMLIPLFQCSNKQVEKKIYSSIQNEPL